MWGQDIANILIDFHPANLAKDRRTAIDLSAAYPGWQKWIIPQSPRACLTVYLREDQIVYVRVNNTGMPGGKDITVTTGWNTAHISPMSAWVAYNKECVLHQTTALANRLDGNAWTAVDNEYVDQKVHAITGSGNVDLEPVWFSFTQTEGWTPGMLLFAAEYTAMQDMRPEWPMYPSGHKLAGNLRVLDADGEDLSSAFQDAWATNNAGLSFSDDAHFDTSDMYEIGRQLGWPMADEQLIGRTFRAMNASYHWQLVERTRPYGGQTRVLAYLLAALHRTIDRLTFLAEHFPGLPGIADLLTRARTCFNWHVAYGVKSYPIAHPFNEGGGYKEFADAGTDYYPLWQEGVLAGCADLAGLTEFRDRIMDRLEDIGLDGNGGVWNAISVDGKVKVGGKDTTRWMLWPFFKYRPQSIITQTLLPQVPKNEFKVGHNAYPFGVRVFGIDIDAAAEAAAS